MMDTEVTIPHTITTEVKITYQGTDLVRAREAAGLTQADLVRITGMARRQVQRYERPHPVTVHEETFEKLMGAIKKPH